MIELVFAGKISEVNLVLRHFEEAFDQSEAELSGCIVPREGVDPEYDFACKSLTQIEVSLEQHLEEQRNILRNATVRILNLTVHGSLEFISIVVF